VKSSCETVFNFVPKIMKEKLFYFRKHVKEFLDLRGCRWAYSDEDSLSASRVILKTLKELGENASFFGATLSE
jgi:ABC-type phosphate/phosphonate transport system substrate-binding protein